MAFFPPVTLYDALCAMALMAAFSFDVTRHLRSNCFDVRVSFPFFPLFSFLSRVLVVPAADHDISCFMCGGCSMTLCVVLWSMADDVIRCFVHSGR